MRLLVQHRTAYRFSEPQARLVQLLRMTPASHIGQTVADWRIDVDCDARLKRGRDGFGNETTMLYVEGPVKGIALEVAGEVITEDRGGAVAGASEPLPPAAFLRTTALTAATPAIAALAAGSGAARDPLDGAHRLMAAIHAALEPAAPARLVRTADEALADGRGSPRDAAHLLIAAARLLGLPARYVSGHRRQPEDGRDHAAHAWAELHLGRHGWIGFDAAAGACPTDAYVRVAIGHDHHDAAPVAGTRTGGGAELLAVDVAVEGRTRA